MLLKMSSRRRKSDAGSGEGIVQSPLLFKTGSSVAESVASLSFYSLTTKTKSVASNLVPDYRLQQPCSSRQAGDALGFSQTQVIEIPGSDSLTTLGQQRSDVRKQKNANGQENVGRTPFCLAGQSMGCTFLQNKSWN